MPYFHSITLTDNLLIAPANFYSILLEKLQRLCHTFIGEGGGLTAVLGIDQTLIGQFVQNIKVISLPADTGLGIDSRTIRLFRMSGTRLSSQEVSYIRINVRSLIVFASICIPPTEASSDQLRQIIVKCIRTQHP